jgi:Family of unknown function (DUF5995)
VPRGTPSNGIYWFNKFYLMVTERVLARTSADHSEASKFVQRLDIEFYGYYQQTLCLTPDQNPVGVAWEPMFERRDDRVILPIFFGFAGVDAHINGNLAAAIVDTLRAMRYPCFPVPGSAEHRLFTALNPILYGVAKECLRKDFTGGRPAGCTGCSRGLSRGSATSTSACTGSWPGLTRRSCGRSSGAGAPATVCAWHSRRPRRH